MFMLIKQQLYKFVHMNEQLEFIVTLSRRGLKNNNCLQVVIFHFWSSRKANALPLCDFHQAQTFERYRDLNQAALLLQLLCNKFCVEE